MTKGQRIKELREKKGLTQVELAKVLGTTKQTISKYEKDIVTNIPSDRVEAIAMALDSTPEYILNWKKEQKNNDITSDIVVRMRTDQEFLDLCEVLYNLDTNKLDDVVALLKAFLK